MNGLRAQAHSLRQHVRHITELVITSSFRCTGVQFDFFWRILANIENVGLPQNGGIAMMRQKFPTCTPVHMKVETSLSSLICQTCCRGQYARVHSSFKFAPDSSRALPCKSGCPRRLSIDFGKRTSRPLSNHHFLIYQRDVEHFYGLSRMSALEPVDGDALAQILEPARRSRLVQPICSSHTPVDALVMSLRARLCCMLAAEQPREA